MPEEFEIPMEATKEEFEKFSEFEKKLFKEVDGVYKPKLKGYIDPVDLKKAKDHEVAQKNELQKKLKEIEDKEKKTKEQMEKNQKSSQEVVDKYQNQLDTLKEEYRIDKEKMKSKAEKALIGQTVSEITSLFTSEKIGSSFAKERTQIEYDSNGEPFTVFIDDMGNKLTKISEIKKIILADEELKSTLKGVESGGSSASAINSRHKAVPTISNFKEAKEQDLVALANADPDAFLALVSKNNLK